jgi:hypothetical protein
MQISRRDSVIQLASAIEFLPSEQINPGNIEKFILFLEMPGLNITKLQLDISPLCGNDLTNFQKLLGAIDALAHQPELQIKVDGRSEGELSLNLCYALARSKVCLSTLDIRKWIFTCALDLRTTSKKHHEYKSQASKLIEALPISPIPEQAALAEELAQLAFNWGNDILLPAACTLAPHCKIKIQEPPSQTQCILVDVSKVPCVFHLNLTSAGLDEFVYELKYYRGKEIFNDMTLTITEDISQESAVHFIESLAGLPSIEHLSLTINPGVSLQVSDFNVSAHPREVKSLIFDGGPGKNITYLRFLRILNQALIPIGLSIRVGTPGAAAHFVASMPKQQTDRLTQLDITCTSLSVGGEPSLLEALEGLLQKTPCLLNISIRSQEPLLADEAEKTVFSKLARIHQPQADIQMEHFSSSSDSWQSYLRIHKQQLSLMAAAFFPHLKLGKIGLPADIGKHAVSIGAMSRDDIPALALVSRTMSEAWSDASGNHDPSVIVSKLNRGSLDESSLKALLTSPQGLFDTALAGEIRGILNRQAGRDERAMRLLNRVAPPDGPTAKPH